MFLPELSPRLLLASKNPVHNTLHLWHTARLAIGPQKHLQTMLFPLAKKQRWTLPPRVRPDWTGETFTFYI